MPINNLFKLVRTDPDGARRVYRRLLILSEDSRLKAHYRVQAVTFPHLWYPMIAPEMVKKSFQATEDAVELIRGNIKYSWYEVLNYQQLNVAAISLANMELAKRYLTRLENVQFDSEALIDQNQNNYFLIVPKRFNFMCEQK